MSASTESLEKGGPSTASAMSPTTEKPVSQLKTLGTVRLRDHDGGHILQPTPSTDPNDPLYWSQGFKYYVLVLLSVAILLVNFVAAGPSVGIVQVALGMSRPPDVSKTAYLFTAGALTQGVSCLWWQPLVNKFGRRPNYIFSFGLYFFACLGAALTTTNYTKHMVFRILIGAAGGCAEALAPVSIADIFFVHERGTAMAVYSAFLAIGLSVGLIVDGKIFLVDDYKTCYWVAMGLVGAVWLLVVFTLPETAFRRDAASLAKIRKEPTSFIGKLKSWHGIFTDESLVRMMIRPLGLILLPPVLWCSCVFGSQLGFIVAISSNVGVPYEEPPFLFDTLQVGYLWFGGIIGALLGILTGGIGTDWIMKKLTERNNGIFEPEFRLPALIPAIILTPVGLMLYGVGVAHQLHWITAAVSIALVNFSIVQATNVSLTYCVDVLKPIAGEMVITVLVFKSAVGFAIGAETNTWVDEEGYIKPFGIMTGIGVACMLPVFIFYYYGKRIRHASMEWKMTSWVGWHDDREDFKGRVMRKEDFKAGGVH